MMIKASEKGIDLTCPTCKQENAYDMDSIEEAASLTCPICNTRFSLSASIQEPIGQKEEPGLPGLPSSPTITPPSPSVPPANFSGGGVTPTPESSDRVGVLLREIAGGGDFEDAINAFLDEEERIEKKTWKGLLSAFTNKIQSMITDISYDGDVGDMISELQLDGVLEIVGDEVEVDLGKLKKSLMATKEGSTDLASKVEFDLNTPPIPARPSPMTPSPTPPGIDVSGELGADIGLPKTMKPSAAPTGSSSDKEDDINKAIETYFC